MTKEQLQEFIQLLELLCLPKKTMYTKPEAAQILGLSQATLNRWMAEGKGPGYKKPHDMTTGKVYYPITELAKFYFEQIIQTA